MLVVAAMVIFVADLMSGTIKQIAIWHVDSFGYLVEHLVMSVCLAFGGFRLLSDLKQEDLFTLTPFYTIAVLWALKLLVFKSMKDPLYQSILLFCLFV